MKKIVTFLAAIAFLANSSANAQTSGQAAAASTRQGSDSNFAWGIGLGALAVIGAVVGIVAASASQTHSSQH